MKNITLGELEKQIMDIIWEYGECSSRDVLIKLRKDKKLAYTTVATILQRLHDKGLLKRNEGKAGYLYSPKLSKQQYARAAAQSFLKKFIGSFGDTAIASFADSIDKLPEKKRKHLLQLIEEHETHK